MPAETYRFAVGGMNCIIIADAIVPLTPGRVAEILINVDPTAINGEWERIQLEPVFCYNCLLIDTGTQRILVDTGHGPEALPDRGHLLQNLEREGISRESIDMVFLSHFHGDHIGGLITSDGELTYPNASYFASRVEWAYWMNEERLAAMGTERAANLHHLLHPIQDVLQLVEGQTQIAPGITTLPMHGHTPGHTGLHVESNGEALLHLVDTAHLLVQMAHPAWSPKFDVQPDISPTTRRAMFDQAARTQDLTLLFHFPFPGLGHIIEREGCFVWHPITISA